MITNLTTLLEDAKKRKYAVGMFTTTSITMAEAVIEAAEELNAPVIIGQAQLFEEFGPMDKYGPYYRKLAEEEYGRLPFYKKPVFKCFNVY